MTEMNFSVPYLDQEYFPDHIRGYESSSMLKGLFKMEIDRANNFCINVFFFY